jgi:hypothetical protein
LNVRGAAEKGGRFAMAAILERAGDGVLAPTLRIAFDGVIEGAQEAGELGPGRTEALPSGIVFADTSGPEVFEFTVKFCEWPNSADSASVPLTVSRGSSRARAGGSLRLQ